MTEVDFHTGLADKLGHACRLLRKAWRAGNRVVVTGDAAELSRLDTLLWTFDPGEFIPHVRLPAGARIEPHLARTPIWLADRPAEVSDCALLVNLGPDAVAEVERHARVIELVADSEGELRSGRARWRGHVEQGHAPRNHSVPRSTQRD